MKAIIVLEMDIDSPAAVGDALVKIDPQSLPGFAGKALIAVDPVATQVIDWLEEE